MHISLTALVICIFIVSLPVAKDEAAENIQFSTAISWKELFYCFSLVYSKVYHK
jgi:hypothetical protein